VSRATRSLPLGRTAAYLLWRVLLLLLLLQLCKPAVLGGLRIRLGDGSS
jgi:hypothetical protein